jgi:hypothetical protein
MAVESTMSGQSILQSRGLAVDIIPDGKSNAL